MTNTARRRVAQFKKWFTRIFDVWYVDVTEAGPYNDRRECLTDNFPYDSPGNLDKTILGSDCALDLHSIEDICQNLKRFYQWSTENCRSGEIRIQAMEDRCARIDQIRASIQANVNEKTPYSF